jgi:hypothetical protein
VVDRVNREREREEGEDEEGKGAVEEIVSQRRAERDTAVRDIDNVIAFSKHERTSW